MNDTTAPERTARSLLPVQGWIGLLLIAVFWPLNWLLPGMRTHVLFFPLWLGYILTVDGLVFLRKGTSLLTRSRTRFIGLFLVSAPAWWLFELFNERVQNWHYLGREQFTDLQFFVLSTFSFSTVIPAIFGTAELMSTFVHRVSGPVIRPTQRTLAAFFIMGVVMLAVLLVWPRYLFPVHVAFNVLYPGTHQCCVGLSNTGAMHTKWRLEASRHVVAGCAHLRIFLGDVEFLFLPQMGLHCPLCEFLAHL